MCIYIERERYRKQCNKIRNTQITADHDAKPDSQALCESTGRTTSLASAYDNSRIKATHENMCV